MMNTLKCWYFVTRSRVSIGHRSLFLIPNWLINSHFLKQANENKLKQSISALTFHSQKANKTINESISYLNPQLRTTNPPMSCDNHSALKVRKHTSCGTETARTSKLKSYLHVKMFNLVFWIKIWYFLLFLWQH